MIKVLLKTSCVLALLLWGTGVFARGPEEVVAPWESEADAELWGERVISDAFSNRTDKMPANALCSGAALERLKSLREKAVKELRTVITEKDGKTSALSLYAEILKNIGEIDIVPLKENERELLSSVSDLPFSISLKDFLSAGKGSEHEMAFFLSPAAVTNSHQFKQKVKTQKSSLYGRSDVKYLVQNVNLNDYSLKASKIDLYILYLYIWEDNPFAGGSSNIFSPPDFPALHFIQLRNHTTKHIPVKITVSVDTGQLTLFKGAALCHVI